MTTLDERNQKIAEMKRQGYSSSEIATEFGISRQRVCQILGDHFSEHFPRCSETYQERMYRFLINYKRDHDGCTPNSREIIDGTRISTWPRVVKTLARLEKEGKITIRRTQNRKRSHPHIEIVGGQWFMTSQKETT